MSVFLQWRQRILFARAAFKGHLDALARRVPIAQQPGRFARKAGRVIRKALSAVFPRPIEAGGNGARAGAPPVDLGHNYYQACAAYVPQPYRGPAHLLWPNEMPMCDSYVGWESTMPQLKVILVPGGHFSFLQGQNLQVASETIRECLLADNA